jgi:acetyl-CoA acetyltransferase
MGKLSHLSPEDLFYYPAKAMLDETGINPALIGDLWIGSVGQGGQTAYAPRNLRDRLGLQMSVNGRLIDEVCGSGMAAIDAAATEVGLDEDGQMIALAGGMQSMSRSGITLPDLLPHLVNTARKAARDPGIALTGFFKNVAAAKGATNKQPQNSNAICTILFRKTSCETKRPRRLSQSDSPA